jgi:AraC-like DNA-binding protein
MTLWGRPDNADIDMIAAALRADPARRSRRQAWLVDLRWLDSIDLGAFGKLSSILASQRFDSYKRVTRQAVLPPDGPAGAIAAAVFATLNQRCPSRSFAEVSEALEWIGVRDPSLVHQLERIRRASSVCPPVVDAIRTYLDGTPASTARETALEIGVSQRTLQRRLRESGTSHQREVTLARLEVAKRLLRTTAHPLKWIALEAGYGSPQHFSSSFRRHTQMSPSRWRADR